MSEQTVVIPDIGGAEQVQIIELPIKVGDTVRENDTLLVLESDKASMEIPAPFAGVVQKILVNLGDKVGKGTPVAILLTEGTVAAAQPAAAPAVQPVADQPTKTTAAPTAQAPQEVIAPSPIQSTTETVAASMAAGSMGAKGLAVHAGPAVRKLARDFGLDLSVIKATGPKHRIIKEDLHAFVKNALANKSANAASGFNVSPIPAVNFVEFGDIETIDLSRIKKLTAINMHRNWVHIPHVTQFDEADITELDAFRKAQAEEAKSRNIKLTPLPFIVKAATVALHKFPPFNASLHASGEKLILKKYCHIGVAVDTEEGLLVPVIRDADKKTVWEIAEAIMQLSEKARSKKLTPDEMKGGCFTISSLGSIGGTAFTPIINAPEVAILGVSKASIKPIYREGNFEPRLMLPLSLSYDHRVIDGVQAARFTSCLNGLLSDIRQLLM